MRPNLWRRGGVVQASIGFGALAFLTIGAFLFYYTFIGTPENRLIYAASTGDIATMKILLQSGVSINARDSELGTTALMSAIENHQGDIVEFLLSKEADVNLRDIHGDTALMSASLKGETIAVIALLKQGAKVNEENNASETAILYAVINGHADIVKLLIKNGANVTKNYTLNGGSLSKSLWEIAKDEDRNDIAFLIKSADARKVTE